METERKIVHNNENTNTQNLRNASHTSHMGKASTGYICIPIHYTAGAPRTVNFQKHSVCSEKTNNGYFRHKATSQSNEGATFYENSPGNISEEPIDLTCWEKRNTEEINCKSKQIPSQEENTNKKSDNVKDVKISNQERPERNFIDTESSLAKRTGRKRKHIIKDEQEIQEISTLEPGIIKTLVEAPDFLQTTDNNRQAEVLKAAKSLFSKRTRTLFHWLYPNAPKAQLKAAVASTWETLGEQEKEFYISQVLGRFGFLQTNLMVNPQLGGLSGILSLPPLNSTIPNQEGNEETSTAVSSLLLSQHGTANAFSWMRPNSPTTSSSCIPYAQRTNKQRKRLGRPPGSKNKKQIKEEFPVLNQIREDTAGDEFQDDPELSREFEQFRWTLHLNDNTKC